MRTQSPSDKTLSSAVPSKRTPPIRPHHNPFDPGLIVPKPWRTFLTQGNDPLDPQIAGFEEGGDALSMHIAVRSDEQISGQR
jgi:hypothetical protein